jgi:predicted permease
MEVFFLVFFKIISVLLSVLVGYIAGKSELVNKSSITSLLFYFIAPIVFFSIPANSHLTIGTLSLALTSFTISCILCFASYAFFGMFWQDNNRNILALSSGTANSVYFMLPVATYLFDENTLSKYMMAVIGVSIYEASVGFYIGARSINSTKQSIERVLKLPLLHAFILGCIYAFFGFDLPDFLNEFITAMKVTLSALGMMVIGLEVSAIKSFKLDFKFTGMALLAKFVFFPIAIGIFILLDKYLLGWYDVDCHKALILLSCAPMAINTIVISSILNFTPEKVAASVLISSLFVLIYIPFMVAMFIM